MCVDPLSIAMITAGGASVMGAIGTYMSGKAEANTYRANADRELAAGYSQESLQRDQDRRQMATQIATLSSRGAALDSGSPLALMRTSARNAELNDLTIRANAQNKASVESYKATATEAVLPYSVAGQLLSGASKMASLRAVGSTGTT